ncbi:DgyrCDS9013 [Dimorphilus gyrociliatus]|uniref:Mitotic spindle assembly checkpoint protein MAD2A n=1 Tax=Dimorphilus gyrociliatus TaxID=2664684 RepID=A0A7I8VW46_9ANNE|nr:DgyrCDS9013 [Dimorphilus gyrociliatus]
MQANKTGITLKGSTQMVTEFFGFGLNSILYQRGVYPDDMFTRKEAYGLSILVTSDPKLEQFLKTVLDQVREWLLKKVIKKLVLVMKNVKTEEIVERWVFNIDCEKQVDSENTNSKKELKDIQNEIRAVLRQIIASVTFLPALEDTCTIDVQVYTDKDEETPSCCYESSALLIKDAEQVKFKSFSTTVHKVQGMVEYKVKDDE